MAGASPQKLPKGKTDEYTLVALSDKNRITALLSGLSIATCNPSVETDVVLADDSKEAADESTAASEAALLTVPTRMSCICCSAVFESRHEQKHHFKSDWHRYNLKQESKNNKCISEEEFETMTGDLSSISGSDDSSSSTEDDTKERTSNPTIKRLKKRSVYNSNDSSDDSESDDTSSIMAATKRHPKVFLRNEQGQLISLYRCVLYHKKNAPNTPAELLAMARQAQTYTRVAMIMLAGGHFSAAVFDGVEAVVHKTFHRYVVRAKRGTIQSVRDNKGSAPKSGGASLRRYNEAALALEIQELLTSWSQQLGSCHLIFLRASTYSRHIFFGGKTPALKKDDLRVRTVPFTTGRPTFNEAKRVHHMLMATECFGDESLVRDFVPISPPRRIHPETGHLVVRPDLERSRPSRDTKGDSKKSETDAASPQKMQKGAARIAAAMENISMVCPAEEDDDRSGGETELVLSMVEMQTSDLREFDCSMDADKRNKKKKKKRKGVQKNEDRDGDTSHYVVEKADIQPVMLDSEDENLKNQLYTCCKLGDLTKLSSILERLAIPSENKGAVSGASNLQPEHNTVSVDSQHRDIDGTATRLPSSVTENRDSSAQLGVFSPQDSDKGNLDRTETDVIDHISCEGTETNRQTTGHCVSSTSDPQSCANVSDANSDKLALDSHLPNRTSNSFIGQPVSDNDSKQIDNVRTKSASDDKEPPALKQQQRFEWIILGQYGQKGSSLLHVAASSGHAGLVQVLLDAGCDPALRDSGGKTAYNMAATKEMRNAFRRYRSINPDRYDYETAQIPSALTADMEVERKQREADKKKAQRKAKQERLKDQKAEEAKAAKEKREKDRFLALSDREKRALAAERRLLSQAVEESTPVLNRCYQCAADISGKVPFVYMDFQFCTPKCLKEHRLKTSK